VGNESSSIRWCVSGRIANGVRLRRHEIVLKPNCPACASMIGDGWQSVDSRAERQPLRRDPTTRPSRRLALSLRAARPIVSTASALSIGISIENLETGRAGRPRAASVLRARRRYELSCRTRHVWLTDAKCCDGRIAVPPKWDFSKSRKDEGDGRQCFEGWEARHDTSGRRSGCVRDEATVPFRDVIIYIPPAVPIFGRTGEPYPGEIGSTVSEAGATLAGDAVIRSPTSRGSHVVLRVYPSSRIAPSHFGRGLASALRIVEHFAAQGAKVGFVDIDEGRSKALGAKIAPAGHPEPRSPSRLSRREGLSAVIAEVGDSLGAITVLVNNAARDDRHSMEEVTPAYWDERKR